MPFEPLGGLRAAAYDAGMSNKTPREEEIQQEQEAKDAEKERLEREEEERLR